MTDPLAQIVELLRPDLSFAKYVEAAGRWRVERREDGRAFFLAPLQGSVWLRVEDQEPCLIGEHDFALIPAAHRYAAWDGTSSGPAGPALLPVEIRPGIFRLGDREGPADVRMLVGYCVFASSDAALLVSLLPALLLARGVPRLAMVTEMAAEELRAARPAGDVVLARLMDVVFIEALRGAGADGSSGVLRGLGDERVAAAIRAIHDRPTAPWTVPALARVSAMSRSSFFERFRRVVGVAPMAYLLHWRMVLAKRMLGEGDLSIAGIAGAVGYASISTFTTAFSRHVGVSPRSYARQLVGHSSNNAG